MNEDRKLEFARERNRVYEAAIGEIRKTADDKSLRKNQKIIIIKKTLDDLNMAMWKLKLEEEGYGVR